MDGWIFVIRLAMIYGIVSAILLAMVFSALVFLTSLYVFVFRIIKIRH